MVSFIFGCIPVPCPPTADISFLEQNLQYLDGILITHAHLDHIGALPALSKTLNVPVYATPFAAAMIRIIFDKNKVGGHAGLARFF